MDKKITTKKLETDKNLSHTIQFNSIHIDRSTVFQGVYNRSCKSCGMNGNSGINVVGLR